MSILIETKYYYDIIINCLQKIKHIRFFVGTVRRYCIKCLLYIIIHIIWKTRDLYRTSGQCWQWLFLHLNRKLDKCFFVNNIIIRSVVDVDSIRGIRRVPTTRFLKHAYIHRKNKACGYTRDIFVTLLPTLPSFQNFQLHFDL